MFVARWCGWNVYGINLIYMVAISDWILKILEKIYLTTDLLLTCLPTCPIEKLFSQFSFNEICLYFANYGRCLFNFNYFAVFIFILQLLGKINVYWKPFLTYNFI